MPGFKLALSAWRMTLSLKCNIPALKASMLKCSKMKQALRIRPGPDQPEQILLRAEAQRRAFSQAKVMRPQGELTPERYSQWQEALDTLAKKKVTEAEGATVVNALKSWAELKTYMEQKDRLFQMPLICPGSSKPVPIGHSIQLTRSRQRRLSHR